ncbi:MAG: hypothetical protein COA64_13035, partial [Henriciella sp.]
MARLSLTGELKDMSQSSIKAALLVGAASIAVSPAFAEAGDAQIDAEARQEVILVTASPIRDSQQAAIEAKRNADNVVDIIAADTIGRFPDQTLAAALEELGYGDARVATALNEAFVPAAAYVIAHEVA